MKCAGGILYDSTYGKVLVVKGRASGKWGFPKGHIEECEDYWHTAVREIYEETGVEVKGSPNYWFRAHDEIYYLIPVDMTQIDPNPQDTDEIEKFGWYSLEELRGEEMREKMNAGLRCFMHHRPTWKKMQLQKETVTPSNGEPFFSTAHFKSTIPRYTFTHRSHFRRFVDAHRRVSPNYVYRSGSEKPGSAY